MSKALLSPGWSLLCLCSQTPCTTQALCAKVKLVHHLTATKWWGPPWPQQCQYCLPDSAYCIWRKVAEHCLPVHPPGSMISPSNKSGKADDLLRWVWPPHTPPWSSSGQGALTSREQTAAAHTAPHLTAWWAPFGSCFNFSLSFLHPYRVRHGNTRQWECTPSNQQMCWEEPGQCPSGRPMSPHLPPEPLGSNMGRRMVPLLKGQKEAVGVGCRQKQAWLHLKYILHVWCELKNSLARLVGIGLSV